MNYTYGTTNNNGNVLTQKITVTGTGGFTAHQAYAYDSLNRLLTAFGIRIIDYLKIFLAFREDRK